MAGMILFLILVIISLSVMSGLAHWMLGPVNRARTRIGAPVRFLITDVFWLMVLIQESLAFATQFVPRGEFISFVLILGFLIFAAVMLWAGGVSFSSQAGVRRLLDRALIILVLLPGTLLVMIGVPATTVITLWSLRDDKTNWSNPLNGHYIAWTSVVLGFFILRLLSSWLARRIFSQLGQETQVTTA